MVIEKRMARTASIFNRLNEYIKDRFQLDNREKRISDRPRGDARREGRYSDFTTRPPVWSSRTNLNSRWCVKRQYSVNIVFPQRNKRLLNWFSWYYFQIHKKPMLLQCLLKTHVPVMSLHLWLKETL